MADEGIKAGQEPAALPQVMTPGGALQALAGGPVGPIAVAGTAQEVSAHLAALAGVAALDMIASIAITDGEPLTASMADFRLQTAAYAKVLQTITSRPLQLNFS